MTSSITATASGISKPQRLYSLDALRGFDMFWIMGAEEIAHAMFKATDSPFWGVISTELTHPNWNGFHFYDLIFPLFLFMAGVATPYSVGRELDKGKSTQQVVFRVVKRAIILVLLGLIVNNGLQIKPIAEIRFGSVLGRIGLAYMFANIIFIFSKKISTLIVWFVSLVIGFWLVMKFNSAPGFPMGDLTEAGNFSSYIDRILMPGKLYRGIHDPEGLASTIPAIATGLLGIITGKFIKNKQFTGEQKTIRMALAGFIFLGISFIWNFDFPINKNLWSSSFVMHVGGYSLLLLALFYYIIDVLGYKKWAFFFKVIGMNSILIYMSVHFIAWEYTTDSIFHWLAQLVGEPYHAAVMAICYVGIEWFFLYFMYKQKIFLSV